MSPRRRRLSHVRSVVQSGEMVSAIAKGDPAGIGSHLYNDFEKVVLPRPSQTAELKETYGQPGRLGTLMSGSGQRCLR